MEHQDSHLNILLDIQKQLGKLGSETATQSEMLKALNDKVAIANGRTSKNENRISFLEEINQLRKEGDAIKKGKNLVWGIVGGFGGSILLALFIGFFKNLFSL